MTSSTFPYSTVVSSSTSPYSTLLNSGTFPSSVVLNSSTSFIVHYPSLILFRECPAAYWLVVILGTFVYLAGVIGNILLLFVMLQKSMRSNTICNYFAAISVADLVHSSMLYSLMMTAAVSRSSIMLDVVMVCGTSFIILVLSGSISSQLLTILCCERFIVVHFPLQSRTWFSSKTSRICIVVVIAFNFIYILPNMMFISDDVANTYGRFVPRCTMERSPAVYVVLISALYFLCLCL